MSKPRSSQHESGSGQGAEQAAAHPTIRRVEALLQGAIALGASDLHVGPEGGGGLATARVDGAFRELERLAADDVPRVIARLKVLAGLPAFRTAEPHDGALAVTTATGVVEARLATVPVIGGEKAVVRFLGLGGAREIGELGFSHVVQARLRGLLELQDGAIVVVGPCSSGKSTTLRAMARAIVEARGEFTHVASAEDPVEQRLPGVTQVEIDLARGLDFPRALVALLRQDPQVLLVGEMRESETARIGIEAALTGHLLLTSLHVGRADDVPRRLELLGVAPSLVAASLRAVVNQRLLRRRCEACEGAAVAAAPAAAGARCEACAGSGHRGRFALAEVAVADAERGALRLITPPLDVAAREALEAGVTTEREVARVLGEQGTASC